MAQRAGAPGYISCRHLYISLIIFKELLDGQRPGLVCSVMAVAAKNIMNLISVLMENPRDGRAWWAAVYGVAQS